MSEACRRSDQLGRVRSGEQRFERGRFVAGAVEVERQLAGGVGGGQREAWLRPQRRLASARWSRRRSVGNAAW